MDDIFIWLYFYMIKLLLFFLENDIGFYEFYLGVKLISIFTIICKSNKGDLYHLIGFYFTC